MHYTIGGNMGGESGTVDFANAFSSDAMSDNLDAAMDADRLCPLCNSEIRLFFINFNEKILMCENTECEFPFGHEKVLLVRSDSNGESEDDELDSPPARTNVSPSGTGSTVSCSEINHINPEVDDSDSEMNVLDVNINDQQLFHYKTMYNQGLNRNIKDIREMIVEEIDEEDEPQIKNEEWLRHLKKLQELSGVKLLKTEEMDLLKKETPVMGVGELKIEIAPSNGSNISIVKVEVHHSGENIEIQAESSQPTGKDPLPV